MTIGRLAARPKNVGAGTDALWDKCQLGVQEDTPNFPEQTRLQNDTVQSTAGLPASVTPLVWITATEDRHEMRH